MSGLLFKPAARPGKQTELGMKEGSNDEANRKGRGREARKTGFGAQSAERFVVRLCRALLPPPMACYPTWAALLKDWILDKTYGTLERACNRAAVLQNVKIPASVVFLGNQPIPT